MNKIFVKKYDIPILCDKIDITTIKNTIPEGSYAVEQPLLSSCKVELRWRFIHLPNKIINNIHNDDVKKVVEISRKKPDCLREYLNKQMKWVNKDVDVMFDEYVVQQYYFYTEE